LQDQQTLKAKLLSASLYPAIVSLIALLIVIFLLSTVVPQVAQVFSGSQRKLPGLTVAMLALSDFVRQHGWLVLFMLALAGLGFQQAMKQAALRIRFDAAFLRLPILGRLATGYNTARFASTLAMLTGAGVPILKALQSAADTLSNQALREDVLDALVAATRCTTAVSRCAAPCDGFGDHLGALAHCVDGRYCDGHRAGRAHAHHGTEPMGQMMFCPYFIAPRKRHAC